MNAPTMHIHLQICYMYMLQYNGLVMQFDFIIDNPRTVVDTGAQQLQDLDPIRKAIQVTIPKRAVPQEWGKTALELFQDSLR